MLIKPGGIGGIEGGIPGIIPGSMGGIPGIEGGIPPGIDGGMPGIIPGIIGGIPGIIGGGPGGGAEGITNQRVKIVLQRIYFIHLAFIKNRTVISNHTCYIIYRMSMFECQFLNATLNSVDP